jgi:hypothetical protein
MVMDQQLEGKSVLQRVACPWFVVPWLHKVDVPREVAHL